MLARGAPRTGEPVANAQLPIIEAYREARCAARQATARIGITRTVYPTVDRRTAIAHLEAGTRLWSQEMLPGLYPASVTADQLFERHSMYAGATPDVIERLTRDQALALATDLIIQLQPGLPTFAQSVAALETIATEVAPVLGWRPASRH